MRKRIHDTLQEYIENDKNSSEDLFNQLTLFIYYLEGSTTKSDMYLLGKILPPDVFKEFVEYFNGDYIKVPTIEEYKKAYLTGICFYLKEIKKWDWVKIKEFIPVTQNHEDSISSIAIGKNIKKIKEDLNKTLLKAIEQTDIDYKDLKKVLEAGD